jgi:uncharacterized protein (DUF952 family)
MSGSTSEQNQKRRVTVFDTSGFVIDKNAPAASFLDLTDKEKLMEKNTAIRRESKWIDMVRKWGVYSTSRKSVLKRRVRKGIPEKFRSMVWMFLSELVLKKANIPKVIKHVSGKKRKEDAKAAACDNTKAAADEQDAKRKASLKQMTYRELLAVPRDANTIIQIEKDITRTFSNHVLFRGGPLAGGKSAYDNDPEDSVNARQVDTGIPEAIPEEEEAEEVESDEEGGAAEAVSVFKIVDSGVWQACKDSQRAFPGAGIDLEDGFIHLSMAPQCMGTLNRFFKGVSGLLLVEVDMNHASVRGDLKMETNPHGTYPHLYRDLDLGAVRGEHELHWDDAQQCFDVPAVLAAAPTASVPEPTTNDNNTVNGGALPAAEKWERKRKETLVMIPDPYADLEAMSLLEVDRKMVNLYNQGQLSLFRVCVAFVHRHPEVGYCQSMAYLGAVILMYMPEEEGYVLMDKLLTSLKYWRYADMYTENFPLLHRFVYMFEQLTRTHASPIYKKFKTLIKIHSAFDSTNILYLSFLAPWLQTFFSSPSFPPAFIIRVWDLFITEGPKILFRVGISILLEFKPQLLACEAFEDAMSFLLHEACENKNFNTDKVIARALQMKVKTKELKKHSRNYTKLWKQGKIDMVPVYTRGQQGNLDVFQ